MFTSWITSYLVPWLVTFVLLGIILQVLDRFLGVPLYRWYFNRASGEEHQMPQAVEMGFFHNQSLRRQHNRAILVSAAQSIATVLFGKFSFGDIVLEIFALVLEGWFLLPGLWLGNKIYALMRHQDEIFDALDHRQEYAAGLMGKAKMFFAGFVSALRRTKQEKPAAPVAPKADVKTEVVPEAPEPHWRDRITNYTNRGSAS